LQSRVAWPNGTSISVEQERVVFEALNVIKGQLALLQGTRLPSKSETSDLLRDTCQNLSDLVMSLEQTWQKVHPGEPQPQWPVEVIPEEEFARIGWDFQANRVQMLNDGNSFWNAIGYLLKADQSTSFAQAPSADEVTRALSRTKERLCKEMQHTAINAC
jgi:hypothetical protein